MKKQKIILILLLVVLTLITFSASCFAINDNFLRFCEFIQYKDTDKTIPAFFMPWKVYEWAQACPEYQDYLSRKNEIFIAHSYNSSAHRWIIAFFPKGKNIGIKNDSLKSWIASNNCICWYSSRLIDGPSHSVNVQTDDWDTPLVRHDGSRFDHLYNYEYIGENQAFIGASSMPVYLDDNYNDLFFEGAPLTGKIGLIILKNKVRLEAIYEEVVKMLPILIPILLLIVGLILGMKWLVSILRGA